MDDGFKNNVKSIWESLNRTIYVGDRRKSNMMALAYASSVSAILGFVLIFFNIYAQDMTMLAAAIVTMIAGNCCAFCVKVLDNRELAIQIPTVFCMVFITLYVITGAGDGSAILWALLIPIGMCYFVSVKNGIFLSAYYSILFVVVFYTPLRDRFMRFYTQGFMDRFPLLYISLSLFTGMAMIQYHRKALFEIDHACRLSEEIAKQTEVAEERSRKIERISFETIQALANAIDAKDPYMKGHSRRVSEYSVKMAEALGWDKDRIKELKLAALLHDVGNIGISDSVLNNPRRLTDVEIDIIKSHTTLGGDILKGRVAVAVAEDVARSHHERYDGHGYPKGLRGNNISEEARIVAVADSFDAMNSNRVFRNACDVIHIRRELLEERGRQFDPHLVNVFVELWDKGELDEIMQIDTDQYEEDTRVSSAVLRSAVESFLNKKFVDIEVDEDAIDVNKIEADLKNRNFKAGAFDVEFSDFTRLYEYASKIVHRFDYPFELVMITLDSDHGKDIRREDLDKAMYYMEQSIRQTIRDVDILTRYGNRHFLVILMGADAEGTKGAMDRIFRGYYKMNGNGAFRPSFEMPDRDMEDQIAG